MAYPAGVSVAVLTVGPAATFFGDDVPLNIVVTPVLLDEAGGQLPHIVHTATGAVLTAAAKTFTAAAGESATISVPHVDQPGWRDPSQSDYTMWAYRLEVTTVGGKTWSKDIQPRAGQDILDTDKVPAGRAGVPLVSSSAVLSIDGKVGHLTAADMPPAQVTSLDVAKLTGVFPDVGKHLAASSILSTKLLLGPGDELIPNGDGRAPEGWTGFGWDTDPLLNDPHPGSFTITGQNTVYGPSVLLRPGRYLTRVRVRGEHEGGRTYVQLWTYDAAGTRIQVDSIAPNAVVPNGTWADFTTEMVIPDKTVRASIVVFGQHLNGLVVATARQWFTGFSARPMIGGDRIPAGTVTGTHINAQSVSDAVGQYIKGLPPGGTTGQVLTKSTDLDHAVAWTTAGAGGTTDHGALTGLTDDDHTIYALADGTRYDGVRVTPVTYFYPDYFSTTTPSLWTKVVRAAPVTDWVIINPASGPGTAANADYQEQARRAKAGGLRVMGYISTSYGTVSADTVKAQTQSYIDWYDVDGLFLDETAAGWSDTEAVITYYESLYAWVRATHPRLVVVGNPGTATAPRILAASDMTMTFEGSAADYIAATDLDQAHYLSRPRGQFWHAVYGVTSEAQARDVIAKAKSLHVGHVYVTDAALATNPWDELPSPWLWDLQVGAFPGVPAHTHAAGDVASGVFDPARLPAVTTTAQGAMLAADKVKLNNAVSAATASRLVIRDAAGRAQFATPSAAADAAPKGYVDSRTWVGSQAAYDALATKDSTVNYLITS